MNNPNPFIPQGSLLEQHKRRSRMKLAVFCTVAVSVCGLTAMLIQGCKREQAPDTTSADMTTTTSPLDTNPPVVMGTNPVANPVVTPVPQMPVTPEPAAGETYVVVKGDTLGKIATAHHVSLKTLEAANPNIQPTRLKVGDKLTIPASTGGGTAAMESTSSEGGEVYVVKSGDSLSKIATTHGTTLKALKAANPNVDPNHITVGQKLKIPTRAEAPTTTVNTPPMPVAPSTPAPAPNNTPNGQ